MRIFGSIILAVVVCFLLFDILRQLRNKDEGGSFANEIMVSVGLAALIGVINYFAPRFVGAIAFMAPLSLLIVTGIIIFVMIVWYNKPDARAREMIVFFIFFILVTIVNNAVAVMTASMIPVDFMTKCVLAWPDVLSSLAIGFVAINYCLYTYSIHREREEMKIIAAIIGVLTLLSLLLISFRHFSGSPIFASLNASVGEEAMEAPGVEAQAESTVDVVDADDVADADTNVTDVAPSASEYEFYNLYLQSDADPRNDFNFGENPYQESRTAAEYDKVLRERMSKDPALAAADMAWLDAIVGTRYLGEFYESCKGDWAKTINFTKDRFMVNQSLYYQTLNAFFSFLDSADGVTLNYQTSDLDDQMYMNPYTVSGAPDVVVMTTTDHAGYFLTYVFVVKDNVFKVSYRIDCGFQPTNVEKVMNIKPDDTPRSNPQAKTSPQKDPKPSGDKGGKDDPQPKDDPTPKDDDDPTPTDTPDPTPEKDPTPTPAKPTPTPKKKKDPTKGTQGEVVKKNDDPTPGESTNNGPGAKTSTKDQPTNSNHMTQQEYKETVAEKEAINQSQKTGGNSNNDPSISDATAHVDNNGETGNGGASIDQPTEKTAPATVAETGDPIITEAAGAWEGPAD